jgi:hypothetical protein
MTAYQLLPGLTSEEYAALRDDIAANGVRVPVDVDENGQVLDGHHRSLIAAELGIACPRRTIAGLTEAQKVAHAIAVNVHRRTLTQQQKRDLLAESIKAEPEASDREHARRVGTSDKTAGAVRAELESTAEVPQLEARRGADGRTRPATQPSRPQPSPAPESTRPDFSAGEQTSPPVASPSVQDVGPDGEPTTREQFVADRDTGEVLSVEDWQKQEQEPSNADLDRQLREEMSTTDEQFRSNLVRACAPTYSVLDLPASRVVETYESGTNAADALELWLIRTTTWIAELRAGLPDLPVYTPVRKLRSVR